MSGDRGGWRQGWRHGARVAVGERSRGRRKEKKGLLSDGRRLDAEESGPLGRQLGKDGGFRRACEVRTEERRKGSGREQPCRERERGMGQERKEKEKSGRAGWFSN